MKSSDCTCNPHIQCTVDSCTHHDGASNCCSLNSIRIGCCDCNPTRCEGTECASFQLNKTR